MTKRNPFIVLLLTCITFGIYGLVWLYKTKEEMVAKGASIPTFILAFIPLIQLYWMWQWAGGVAHVTGGKTSQVLALILLLILGPIGFIILQMKFNEVA